MFASLLKVEEVQHSGIGPVGDGCKDLCRQTCVPRHVGPGAHRTLTCQGTEPVGVFLFAPFGAGKTSQGRSHLLSRMHVIASDPGEKTQAEIVTRIESPLRFPSGFPAGSARTLPVGGGVRLPSPIETAAREASYFARGGFKGCCLTREGRAGLRVATDPACGLTFSSRGRARWRRSQACKLGPGKDVDGGVSEAATGRRGRPNVHPQGIPEVRWDRLRNRVGRERFAQAPGNQLPGGQVEPKLIAKLLPCPISHQDAAIRSLRAVTGLTARDKPRDVPQSPTAGRSPRDVVLLTEFRVGVVENRARELEREIPGVVRQRTSAARSAGETIGAAARCGTGFSAANLAAPARA